MSPIPLDGYVHAVSKELTENCALLFHCQELDEGGMECKMRGREHVVFLLLTLSIVLNSIVGCVPGATLPTPTSTSSIAISAPSIPSDLVRAREALITYFSLLHAGRYSEAIHYYGGAYDVLRDWNPTVAEDDYAVLFQQGCTANGLKCLRIRTIVHEEQVSPTEFKFTVEFMNDDGTLFIRGPCCGAMETQNPPQSQFTFTVKKADNRFLIEELPVYVP